MRMHYCGRTLRMDNDDIMQTLKIIFIFFWDHLPPKLLAPNPPFPIIELDSPDWSIPDYSTISLIFFFRKTRKWKFFLFKQIRHKIFRKISGSKNLKMTMPDLQRYY